MEFQNFTLSILKSSGFSSDFPFCYFPFPPPCLNKKLAGETMQMYTPVLFDKKMDGKCLWERKRSSSFSPSFSFTDENSFSIWLYKVKRKNEVMFATDISSLLVHANYRFQVLLLFLRYASLPKLSFSWQRMQCLTSSNQSMNMNMQSVWHLDSARQRLNAATFVLCALWSSGRGQEVLKLRLYIGGD